MLIIHRGALSTWKVDSNAPKSYIQEATHELPSRKDWIPVGEKVN